MRAQALVRLWTQALLASVTLRGRTAALAARPVTLGEARREIPRRHRRRLLVWLHEPILSGVHLEMLFDLFAA